MSAINVILIGVVAIALFAYAAPETFNEYKTKLFDMFKSSSEDEFVILSPGDIPYPSDSLNSTNKTVQSLDADKDGDYDLEDYELKVYGTEYADYGYYGTVGYPEKNACGYRGYGYPAYIGTTNEGKTCKDFTEEVRDSECLANTPVNYDGIINLGEGFSDPVLDCCDSDGTCQWVK